MSRVEIGYLCGKGHFVFHDDAEADGSCLSRRIGGVYVEREIQDQPAVEDESYSFPGYGEQDYADDVAEARWSLGHMIGEWRES